MRAIVIAAAMCCGCVGGDGGGGSGQSPGAKCDRLWGLACARIQECGEAMGEPVAPGFQDDCLAVIDCDRVTAVSPSYDSCVSELETAPCSDIWNDSGDPDLPAACNNVLVSE